MILWTIYIVFLSFAVFLDYRFFASSSSDKAYKKAIQSMSYWGVICLATLILVYIAYQKDLFQSFLSQDTQLSGSQAVSLFLSGYLVEQSLSIDNIFVIAFLLSYFQVPERNQSGLLSIGIWTAIVLRGILVIVGIWLIQSLDWMVYVLGVLLIYSGYKIYTSDSDHPEDPNKSLIIRAIRRTFPVTKGYFNDRFFVKKMGIWAATPLFITLISIEFTDVLFALDSIPAIFAITTDPFLVLSSNILAVANLRALYTILSKMLSKLEYLHYALAVLLVFIGVKILISHQIHLPEWLSFVFIILCLGVGTLYSLWRSKTKENHQDMQS